MKKFSKLLALLLALVMVFSVLAACAKDEADTNKGNGGAAGTTNNGEASTGGDDAATGESEKDTTLKVGLMATLSSHDLSNNRSNRTQSRTIYEKLFAEDPATGEIVPQLALSAEYTDETTLVVKLREGVKFTDGQEMTAKDVMYSLRDLWGANNMASYFACYDWEASKIVDDYTIEFKFTKPYGPAVTYMAAWAIVCAEDYENGADPDKMMTSPNGTSPYYCVENVDGSHAKYVRKDAEDYWGELPECTEITYKYYSESSTMYIDFESGAIDVACGIAATDAQRVLDGDCPEFTGYYMNSIDDNLLCILPEEIEMFNDERVRKAFFMSIDREAVAIAQFGCLYLPADSILPDTVKYYESQADLLVEYDPEGAKALLAEAGYPDGLNLRLIVTMDMSTLAEALQASLSTGGINITVESYDIPTAVPMLQAMESDFICKQAEGGAYINEPGLLVDTLSPVSTLPPAGMQDPVWAEAFDQAHYTTSDEDRAAGFAAMQEWAVGEYRMLPICTRANMTVYNAEKLASFVMSAADEPTPTCAVFN